MAFTAFNRREKTSLEGFRVIKTGPSKLNTYKIPSDTESEGFYIPLTLFTTFSIPRFLRLAKIFLLRIFSKGYRKQIRRYIPTRKIPRTL